MKSPVSVWGEISSAVDISKLERQRNLELTVDPDRSVFRALKARRNRCTTFEMKKVLELIGRPIGYTFGQALCHMERAMAGDRHAAASKAAASAAR